MISKEALPDPTIIPARRVVSEYLPLDNSNSTRLRERKCSDNLSWFTIPLK